MPPINSHFLLLNRDGLFPFSSSKKVMAPSVANALTNSWSNAHLNVVDKISWTSLTDLAAGTAMHRSYGEQKDDTLTFKPERSVAAGRSHREGSLQSSVDLNDEWMEQPNKLSED